MAITMEELKRKARAYDEALEKAKHLFTIADAKDGDVLVDVYGNIGIYQKNDDFYWKSYWSLGCYGGFQPFIVEHEIEGTCPATKEQRDLLFQKIKEAGYGWDAEKKESKKIHVIDDTKTQGQHLWAHIPTLAHRGKGV